MSKKLPPKERIGSIPPFGLRMPAALRDRVTEAAKMNKRSVNAEIVARLEASLEANQTTIATEAKPSASSASREPTMEEILAAIRRIVAQDRAERNRDESED